MVGGLDPGVEVVTARQQWRSLTPITLAISFSLDGRAALTHAAQTIGQFSLNRPWFNPTRGSTPSAGSIAPGGDHAASSKTCPKFLKEQAVLRYKAENGGTFQQARKSVVVEIHKRTSNHSYAGAVKTRLQTKPAVLPKDGGRSVPSAPPKWKKAQKDSVALSAQRAAETETSAKRRAEKSKRQGPLGNHSIVLCLWPWNLRRLYLQSGKIPPRPAPRGPSPPLWSALPPLQTSNSLQIPPPARGGEIPRSSAFPLASLPLHP
ncbi:hypothetical protein PoB_000329400 [Plakobranchus ocellatus]|uniref:60S ribosomal protein L28 n=1 Tax=Plakobranchus ocellatus TaxID=259542 RepID=A0AAV3Y3J3_9GAST|nr:hypothetical protein PoB_000329400 [Plakobranchus ocellatus]